MPCPNCLLGLEVLKTNPSSVRDVGAFHPHSDVSNGLIFPAGGEDVNTHSCTRCCLMKHIGYTIGMGTLMGCNLNHHVLLHHGILTSWMGVVSSTVPLVVLLSVCVRSGHHHTSLDSPLTCGFPSREEDNSVHLYTCLGPKFALAPQPLLSLVQGESVLHHCAWQHVSRIVLSWVPCDVASCRHATCWY
jgi:hypothetical protein